MKANTKVVTGKETRLSYFNGWKPISINGGDEKYSTQILIPKDDLKTLSAIEKAVDAAIDNGLAKFGGKKPNKQAIKLPPQTWFLILLLSTYQSYQYYLLPILWGLGQSLCLI